SSRPRIVRTTTLMTSWAEVPVRSSLGVRWSHVDLALIRGRSAMGRDTAASILELRLGSRPRFHAALEISAESLGESETRLRSEKREAHPDWVGAAASVP